MVGIARIIASTDIEDTTQLEMRRIALEAKKNLRDLYRDAIEEYARNHKVASS